MLAGHGWVCIFPLLLSGRCCSWLPRECQGAPLVAFISFWSPFPLVSFVFYSFPPLLVSLPIAFLQMLWDHILRRVQSRENSWSLRMILDSWLLNASALFWENWSYKSGDTLVTVANILVYSNGMANQEMTGKCVVSQSREGRKTPLLSFCQIVRTSIIVWEAK